MYYNINMMNRRLIVLYTFDTNLDKSFSTKALKLSILTVLREFGKNTKIVIYTTTLSNMRKVFKKYLKFVDIRFYDKEIFGQYEIKHAEYYKRFNMIGHSRMFILPYLLHKEKTPILYLDSDVVISLGWGPEILNKLKTLVYPYGCNAEDNIKPNEICINSEIYQTPFDTDFIYANDKTYSVNITNINNGVMYFPYTDISIHMCNEMLGLYKKMREINPIIYNDMFAFSMVLHSYNYYPKYGIESYQYKNVSITDPLHYISHFYAQKYMERYLDAFCSFFVPMLEEIILDKNFKVKSKLRKSLFKPFYKKFLKNHSKYKHPKIYTYANYIESSVLTSKQIDMIYKNAPVKETYINEGEITSNRDYEWFELLVTDDMITSDTCTSNYVYTILIMFVFLIILTYIGYWRLRSYDSN